MGTPQNVRFIQVSVLVGSKKPRLRRSVKVGFNLNLTQTGPVKVVKRPNGRILLYGLSSYLNLNLREHPVYIEDNYLFRARDTHWYLVRCIQVLPLKYHHLNNLT